MEAAKPAAEASSQILLPGGLRISKWAFTAALLALDALLVSLIISYVPYTKIDWDAYMSQVDGFIEGERDYMKLKGDTGPLVYPAGFLYIYTALKFVTGGQVYPAQVLFGVLYIINLATVMFIYLKTEVLPWWAFCLFCLSRRVHSIFMLRLFNDCFAMTLLHAAVASILCEKWHLALIIFSAAVSVKMNVLLFAPPLFLLMLKAMNVRGVFSALFGAALLQAQNGVWVHVLPFMRVLVQNWLKALFFCFVWTGTHQQQCKKAPAAAASSLPLLGKAQGQGNSNKARAGAAAQEQEQQRLPLPPLASLQGCKKTSQASFQGLLL